MVMKLILMSAVGVVAAAMTVIALLVVAVPYLCFQSELKSTFRSGCWLSKRLLAQLNFDLIAFTIVIGLCKHKARWDWRHDSLPSL